MHRRKRIHEVEMSDHSPVDPAKVQRQKRLEETLKENLRRRKAQARARIEALPDESENAGFGKNEDE